MSRSDAPTASTAPREGRRGAEGRKGESRASQKLTVRSVLIEPRDNEPPRVSVSVEYESEAPSLKALQKAAMEAVHSVVRAQTFVDLGERQNVQRGELTKCFSAEPEKKAGNS